MKITQLTLAISLFALALLLPEAAFAAQQSATPLPVTEAHELDPYLAEAINSLPNYSYQQAGSAAAAASPLTQAGNWPHAHRAVGIAKAVPRPADPVAAPVATGGAVVVLEGQASYYSRAGCLGCDANVIMANGQPLNDNALTMAIGANLKHLVGHNARVTSLATGRAVMVRITDTGGFYQAKYGYRVADLTIATKAAIGMAGGVGQVRVEVF